MQQQLKQLIQQKDQLEAKLTQLEFQINALNETKQFNKGVIDAQGFPRADIDFGELAHYKNLKRQKAELNNDHFALMKQIEKKLAELHSSFPDIDPAQEQIKPTQPQEKLNPPTMIEEVQRVQEQKPIKLQAHKIDYLTPFAKISIVDINSPAEKADLKVGDFVSEFSEVNIYTINNLKEIPKYVKEGKPVDIVVLRRVEKDVSGQNIFELKDGHKYRKITINMVPSIWQGKGLLGCKIDPLTN